MKNISIDNGYSFVTPAEALESVTIDILARYMDADTMEKVHCYYAPYYLINHCTDEEFLAKYLELAEEDLIFG